MSFYNDNESTQISSATYRKAKSIIEDSVGITIPNSRSPKQDLVELADSIDDKIIETYKQGIRRGCKQIISWLADGTIQMKDGNFIVKNELAIEIKRLKFNGSTQIFIDRLAPHDVGLDKI